MVAMPPPPQGRVARDGGSRRACSRPPAPDRARPAVDLLAAGPVPPGRAALGVAVRGCAFLALTAAASLSRSLSSVRLVFCASRRSAFRAFATSLYASWAPLPRSWASACSARSPPLERPLETRGRFLHLLASARWGRGRGTIRGAAGCVSCRLLCARHELISLVDEGCQALHVRPYNGWQAFAV
jgi:hypothetical protein